MEFKEIIEKLEYESFENAYIFKLGNAPVMITAVHTMGQIKKDGTMKLAEPFTKAIARYVSEKVNASYFIKLKDTTIDSNSLESEYFKIKLIDYINQNNIKLVIDLHGANISRDFDVEFGTLNNLSADFSTIKELEDAFIENRVKNLKHNNPFKGGGITQSVFSNTNIDVIQLEINRKFRDSNNHIEIEKICNSLISFIKQYSNYN